MLNKKNLMGLIISSTVAMASPLMAQTNLTISNNADHDATGIVNDGICSSAFGPQGIIRPHTSITIYQEQLRMACGFDTKNCKADLYMSDDCSGPKAGTIILDVDVGVTKTESSTDYALTAADPYHVSIDPASYFAK